MTGVAALLHGRLPGGLPLLVRLNAPPLVRREPEQLVELRRKLRAQARGRR